MRTRLKHVLVALVVALCGSFAHSPLFRGGLSPSDYEALASAASRAPVASAKPLARASVRATLTVVGPLDATTREAARAASRSTAAWFRAENLLLLAAAALGLATFLRRLLLPWIGNDSARVAGLSAALLLLLHPLSGPVVADVASHGDLLGAALGLWAAAAFLRGRQDRFPAAALVALALALAAGLASDVALGLGPLLFLAELFSSRRYRPLRVRLRTAATSLAIFGAATCADRVRYAFVGGGDPWPPAARALRDAAAAGRLDEAALKIVEELGLLVLPVNPAVLGVAGVIASGAVFLVAAQPALWAARSAPRLWGWVLSSWVLALVVSALLHADGDVAPEQFGRVPALLPSVIVLTAGLGVASTALSSPRRPYVAWCVAVAFAALAHGNVRPWRGAGAAVADLRAELVATLERVAPRAVWVLDPPAGIAPRERLDDALRALAHPALRGDGPAEAPAPEVRALAARAFLALVGEPEFDAAVEDGLALLYPARLVEADTVGAAEGEPGRRAHHVVEPAEPSSGRRSWSSTLSSQVLDLSTWRDSAVRATIPADQDPGDLARLSWLTKGPASQHGSVEGAWFDSGDQRVGVFDLGSSLAWRLGGRVRRLLFEEGTRSIGRAEIWSALPALDVEGPRVEPEGGRERWHFPAGEGLDPPPGGAFVLELVDVETLAWSRHDATGEGPDGGPVFAGLAPRASEPEGARWLWTLEVRIDEHAVARARGRL